MLSTLPGGGLGFTCAKLIAFGLGAVTEEEIAIPPPVFVGLGGGGSYSPTVFNIADNAYSRRKDDSEIIDFLTIIFQVIE
jgi:hypothetical protein